MNEELAKYHYNIGIVMVKSLHSKGTCRHDKFRKMGGEGGGGGVLAVMYKVLDPGKR